MAEPVDGELLLKLAKNLQATYSKQTSGGEPRKWRDVPAEERRIWTRLARSAARILAPPTSPAQ
jgi:hypothetical protein